LIEVVIEVVAAAVALAEVVVVVVVVVVVEVLAVAGLVVIPTMGMTALAYLSVALGVVVIMRAMSRCVVGAPI